MATNTYRDIPGRLSRMLPFQGNSMSAKPCLVSRNVNLGELTNRKDVDRLAADEDRILYVVYSYDTPIAWVCHGSDDPDRLPDPVTTYVVEQRFSTTTSRHQNLCHAWL